MDHSGVYGIAGEVSAYDTTNTNYALNIDAGSKVHDISELLYGIFIEDINFAADGGLYAEMVQNRSFEFTSLAQGNEKHGWSDIGEITARVETKDKAGALNENNPNYMVLENVSDGPAGITNRGFLDGMAVTGNAGYDFSIYARGLDGYTGPLYAAITVDGEVVAEGEIPNLTDQWKKYELVLTPSVTAYSGVKLQITIGRGAAAIDMVSLFPQDTYKGRENGLRKDLAEKLEELHSAVNETGAVKTYAIDIAGTGELEDTADVDLVAGESLTDDNILGREEVVTMESSQVSGISSQFNYTVPAYSVTVLRLHRK